MLSRPVSVRLPRFRFDEKLSLADTLAGMGMRDLFKDGATDRHTTMA